MTMQAVKPLPEGVQRVAAALQAQGHPHAPVMLMDAARTAQQAADALGIALGQIAKSIIFRRLSDDAAVLVVTAGDERVDENKVAALVGPLGRADAAFVKSRTGYSIGGVPPIAHLGECLTLIDRELFRFDEIWAAAGHPHSVFRLHPQDLARLTGAAPVDVVQEVASPCTSVCRMNDASQVCEGCWRTLDEIAQWGSANNQTKRAIAAQSAQRKPQGPT